MNFKQWHKITLFCICILIISGLVYYSNLSNRHKAIVKTHILYTLNIIDSDWKKNHNENTLEFTSPSFLIDNIYKSMEGPKALQYFSFNTDKDELLWMTYFQVTALDKNEENILSNDFICHTNINFIPQDHHGRWNLNSRMNNQFPRLISLSHGVEKISFPKGFGYPFFSDEKFFMVTQSLNHNVTDSIFQVKHRVSIGYSNKKSLKPLYPKLIFMMLPYDTENPYEIKQDMPANSCIPIETKNHTYQDEEGNFLSGHWKIFKGKSKYTYNVTNLLAIKDTVTLHQITPHLHPFAERFRLIDNTSKEIIYSCEVTNHKNGIGLTDTPSFKSEKGIKMYPTHDYQLELTTNNTTTEIQDMMASLFLFFYDKEMDEKIKKYNDAL
ncbi:MAG: hypothetical protein HRT69_05365 [Flavobacteriaceae bacterium]|nr:hypothetical protein [Flavobacteriaceae bacterium]